MDPKKDEVRSEQLDEGPAPSEDIGPPTALRIAPGQRWTSPLVDMPELIIESKSPLLVGWWLVRFEPGHQATIDERTLLADYTCSESPDGETHGNLQCAS